jgi:hypothetical protein
LSVQYGNAAEIDELTRARIDPEHAQLAAQTLGGDGNVHRTATERHAVLDIDVVRAIDTGDELPDLAIHAKHDDCPGGRGHFHGAEDETVRGILRMHPDRGIVGIVRQRRRAVFGFDFQRLRKSGRRWRRFARILVGGRRIPPASGRGNEDDACGQRPRQRMGSVHRRSQNRNFTPS